jgi:hypothetical protein
LFANSGGVLSYIDEKIANRFLVLIRIGLNIVSLGIAHGYLRKEFSREICRRSIRAPLQRLLQTTSSRLKQTIALFDNMDAVSKKAPWIERNELKFTVNALIRYANALTSFAEVTLGKTAGVSQANLSLQLTKPCGLRA